MDWEDDLNTQAASLAILIYSIRYGIRLAEYAKDQEQIKMFREKEEVLKKSAVEHFWDEEQEMFVSGKECQVSWAMQIWMILARVFPKEKSHELILRTIEVPSLYQRFDPYR